MNARARVTDWQFLVKAVALMTVLYGVYYYPFDASSAVGGAIDAYLRAQARAAGAIVALFDHGAMVSETFIQGRFPVQIVKSCSSLDAQALYAAAVLAFPARVTKRAWGLLLGIAALNVLNLARIAGLCWVGAYAPLSFDAIHEEVLPLVLVMAACGMFAVWTRWAAPAEAHG